MRAGGPLLAMTLASLMMGACATAPAGPGKPDYAKRVEARIEAARALEVQKLRFNPTPCNCPPFEIALEGRWHRVAFDAPEDAELMVALQAATRTPDAQRRTFALRGSLSDSLETCGKGAIFVTFTPTAWDDQPTAATPTPTE